MESLRGNSAGGALQPYYWEAAAEDRLIVLLKRSKLLNVSLANPSQRSHFLTLLITSHVLCSVSTSLFRKYGEKNFRKRSLGHFHDCFLR